jgi:hypothetical protein
VVSLKECTFNEGQDREKKRKKERRAQRPQRGDDSGGRKRKDFAT